MGANMPDLSQDQIRAQLESLGFAVFDEDLPEITHRVNALHEALVNLDDPEIDSIEPLPIFWLAEEK
ncbi:MAG: hypothetical protein C1O27_001817 [Chloroflexi bacterium]|jgi:hypothetical protein|nr:MAG: hypothetical protein C1O27_001817 [Chloroflexota bacterium]